MTSRGLQEADFVRVAELLHKGTALSFSRVWCYDSPTIPGVQIGLALQANTGKLLKNFLPALETSEEIKVRNLSLSCRDCLLRRLTGMPLDIKALKEEVESFASAFPMPGFDGH